MKVIVYRIGERVSVVSLPPDAEDIRVMDSSALPPDRGSRNDWRIKKGRVVVAAPAKEDK